jgi:CHAD domain-containing protein
VNAADTETIHRTRIAFKRFRYMVDALAALLPTVTDRHRQAMRGYQSMMGDIQDVEVLIATLNKFIKHGHRDPATKELQVEFARRRDQLIRVYLNAAGKLQQFWPLQSTSGTIATTGRGKP